MEAFWFDGDAQWAPIGLLSGGERRRLQLLLTLAGTTERAAARRADQRPRPRHAASLEDFLDDWPGALVVVSHDRAFLERTVADVIVLDGAGTAGRRPGGYAAYEEERRASRGGGRRAVRHGPIRIRRRGRPDDPQVPLRRRIGAAGRRRPHAAATGDQEPVDPRHQLKKAEKDLAGRRQRHDVPRRSW